MLKSEYTEYLTPSSLYERPSPPRRGPFVHCGENPGKDESMSKFKYKQQYAVVVICADEAEQQDVYERLLADGYTLKVVAV